ncbi:MAG: 5-(carboxyamino)imidazole ribonucleotide synthase, partial [Patescibacteria group bacterium]|nr:5-(carboxyamino)imidazole ribonucleotide synthase [Patescibacteria group bacterium]
YEIESGNSKVLESLKAPVSVNPSPATLRIIQDKFTQKTFLKENDIPVPEFLQIESLVDLKEKIPSFGYPVLLKARRDAYDGRGNFKIENDDQIELAYKLFEGRHMMIEKHVDFKMEVSVIAARNTIGDIATYPVVENIHRENILEMTIAPARVDASVTKNAESIAKRTMEVLHGAGVFGIEMFVTRDNHILINEIAPRVHNSGHHTLQSSDTSQFEQHLRAILGLPLGSTRLKHYAVMRNVLGPKDFSGRYKPITLEDKEGVYLKMYNKDETKPQRKLGHINIIDFNDAKDVDVLIAKSKQTRDSIKFEPLN